MPHLMDLPVELREHIATFVCQSDLPAMRLVSREMDTSVFDVYSKALFTDRAFLLSDRWSMETLQNISQHETFARELQRIRFSSLVLQDPGTFEYLWNSDLPESTKIERTADPGVVEGHRALKRSEQDFLNNHFERTLKSIFKNLRRIDHYLEISFLDDYTKEQRERNNPFGLKLLKETLRSDLLALNVIVRSESTCSWYHQLFYKTLVDTQYSPRSLQLGQFDSELPLGCFVYRPQRFPGAHLHTLRLNFAHLYRRHSFGSGNYTSPRPNRRQILRGFAIALSSMPGLKCLKLYYQSNHINFQIDPYADIKHRDVFHCLATNRYIDGSSLKLGHEELLLPRLERIDLAHHGIEFDLMLRFCSDRKRTLRTVELEHIVDYERRDPRLVEQQIRDSLLAGSNEAHSAISISLKNSFNGSD